MDFEIDFRKEEVLKAINDLVKERALDGFNIACFWHYWSIVKGKLYIIYFLFFFFLKFPYIITLMRVKAYLSPLLESPWL